MSKDHKAEVEVTAAELESSGGQPQAPEQDAHSSRVCEISRRLLVEYADLYERLART